MRVLYLAHRVPYAPNRGDRIRAFHTLKHLKAAGVEVHLVALAQDAAELGHEGTLAELVSGFDVVRVPRLRNLLRGAVSLPGPRPLTHVLLDSPDMTALLGRRRETFRPDVVLAFCSGMARFALEPPLDSLPFVLDMVDVDSCKWEALAAEGSWLRRRIYAREARLLRHFEVRAARVAQVTLVVSDREREAMRALDASLNPVVVGNGVDVNAFRRPVDVQAGAAPEVVFTGVLSYQPNHEAVMWLLDRVWPRVLEARADARLTVVGAEPRNSLRALARTRGASVTGAVPDVRPYLWRARAAVAPIHTARGVQNKVLEALAAGLRVVVTPEVFEGLPEPARRACREATGAGAFAAAILELLEAPPAPDEGPDWSTLSWDARLEPLVGLLSA